jgi:hypothetical protein
MTGVPYNPVIQHKSLFGMEVLKLAVPALEYGRPTIDKLDLYSCWSG